MVFDVGSLQTYAKDYALFPQQGYTSSTQGSIFRTNAQGTSFSAPKLLAAPGAYVHASAAAGFGADYTISGPSDGSATLAVGGKYLFIAAGNGIWRAGLGAKSATLMRDYAALRSDMGTTDAVLCGTRKSYGKGAAFNADAGSVYIICAPFSSGSGDPYLLRYDHGLKLQQKTELQNSWTPLGRLSPGASHVCSLQQLSYSSSPKFSILRCVKR